MLKACSHLTLALLFASSSITWSYQQTSTRHNTQRAAHTQGTVIAFLQLLAKPNTTPVPTPSPGKPDGEGPIPPRPAPGPQPPDNPDPEPGPLPEPD